MVQKELLTFIVLLHIVYARFTTEDPESWTGKWLPERPAAHVKKQNPEDEKDSVQLDNRVPMGISNSKCDDAKTNLTLDWSGSFEDYTCLRPRLRIEPDDTIPAIIEEERIPVKYLAPHYCMDTEIVYDSPIPTFGAHRPLWPKYGEYRYVPMQRWIHSLEHGGIVALYHPCADPGEVHLLRKLVRSCLRRHVITAHPQLDKLRPLALVAWGSRMQMSTVDPLEVRAFIQQRALKGPEKLSKEGQFEQTLLQPAQLVSDIEDTQLCPKPFDELN